MEASTDTYTVYDGKTALESGYYVVNTDVEVSSILPVNGTPDNPTHLILCDGAKLTASAGINVTSGKSLVIYGQSGGTGVA